MMRRLRWLVPVLVAVVMAPLMLVATPAPTPASALDVYITPGTHTVNGRQWNTVCEKYSQTQRCTTKIFATQVTQVGSRFVQTNAWVFNNLTYAASDRVLWRQNPLGAYAAVGGTAEWTEGGRKWRTECDSAATGRQGCRSFTESRVIEAYTARNGSRSFRWVTTWVFNNMVRFTSTPVTYPRAAAMTQAPSFLKSRRHFSLASLVTQTNAGTEARGVGRLSNIELDPGGKLGTFRESYWTYSYADAVETDYGRFRASIPTQPTGCRSTAKDALDRTILKLPALRAGTCDVRAARTFLGGPTVRTGTYEAVSGNRIKLYWNNSFVTETYYNVTPPTQTYSELRLSAHTHPEAVNAIGFMFGSTKPRGPGRSLSSEISKRQWEPPRSVDPGQVSQSLFPFNAGGADKTMWTQSVGSPALKAVYQSFRFQDYEATSGGCIVTPAAVRGRVVYGWHSYMCPLPSDGKMVWHHMVASLVAEGHGLCPAYVEGTSADAHWKRCEAASPQTVGYGIPARGGGHILEGLQVPDDNNNLVAIVGLETSLYSHKPSSKSALALFATITSTYGQ